MGPKNTIYTKLRQKDSEVFRKGADFPTFEILELI